VRDLGDGWEEGERSGVSKSFAGFFLTRVFDVWGEGTVEDASVAYVVISFIWGFVEEEGVVLRETFIGTLQSPFETLETVSTDEVPTPHESISLRESRQ
jgi:hypothetical protein